MDPDPIMSYKRIRIFLLTSCLTAHTVTQNMQGVYLLIIFLILTRIQLWLWQGSGSFLFTICFTTHTVTHNVQNVYLVIIFQIRIQLWLWIFFIYNRFYNTHSYSQCVECLFGYYFLDPDPARAMAGIRIFFMYIRFCNPQVSAN